MNRDAVAAVVLALVSIAGVGMVSTTMGSAVETTPDDVVDLEASAVPFGSGDLRDFDERVNGDVDSVEAAEARDAPDDEPGDTETTKPDDRGDPSAKARPPDSEERQESTRSNSKQGTGFGPVDRSWLDRLLALLRALLEFLLSILPLVALVGVIALGVYKRDAIRDRLAGYLDDRGSDAGAENGVDHVTAPQNEVTRAWDEMVSLLDVDGRTKRTPREVARVATERGVDRDAVDRVTSAFEEVRYGQAEVTPARRERALDGLERVRSQYGAER